MVPISDICPVLINADIDQVFPDRIPFHDGDGDRTAASAKRSMMGCRVCTMPVWLAMDSPKEARANILMIAFFGGRLQSFSIACHGINQV